MLLHYFLSMSRSLFFGKSFVLQLPTFSQIFLGLYDALSIYQMKVNFPVDLFLDLLKEKNFPSKISTFGKVMLILA